MAVDLLSVGYNSGWFVVQEAFLVGFLTHRNNTSFVSQTVTN